jgi:hypothetical protein
MTAWHFAAQNNCNIRGNTIADKTVHYVEIYYNNLITSLASKTLCATQKFIIRCVYLAGGCAAQTFMYVLNAVVAGDIVLSKEP